MKPRARRIQSEFLWDDDVHLSLATIHKTLANANVGPLKRPPRRKHCTRYERPVPGDRVQMDTCKIWPGLYQYTAVDDCTRYRVLRVYPRRTAANTLDFLDAVIEEMAFPIQRIQTDRGSEFFAHNVQERLMEYGIKFRPIRPASPHLLDGPIDAPRWGNHRASSCGPFSRLGRFSNSLVELTQGRDSDGSSKSRSSLADAGQAIGLQSETQDLRRTIRLRSWPRTSLDVPFHYSINGSRLDELYRPQIRLVGRGPRLFSERMVVLPV